MAKEVERRYDTAGNLASVTPAFAEVGFDSTNKRILIGDGSRVSGYPAASFEDVQDQAFVYAGTAGGTADALELSFGDGTLDYSPTALVEGQRFAFKAASNNTGSVTVDILDSSGTSLGTRNVKKITDSGKADLEADDIVANGVYSFTYDGTDFQLEGGIGGAGGAWEFISEAVASNDATVEFTGLESTYDIYKIFIFNLKASSDLDDFRVFTSSDNGATFDKSSSDYRFANGALGGTTVSNQTASSVGRLIDQLSNDQGAADSAHLEVTMTGAQDAGIYTKIYAHGEATRATNSLEAIISSVSRREANTVNALQFAFGSANIAQGRSASTG